MLINFVNDKSKSNIRTLCFYLALIIEIGIVLVDKSALMNPYEGKLFRVTFVLFGMALLLTHYTWKEWLTIGAFGLLGVISYLVTGRNEIIRIVVFVAACKQMDMKRVMKVLFWTTLAGCLVIVAASGFGIFGAVSLTQQYDSGAADTRYTFGMGHPNALYCMAWALMLLGMYVYQNKMKWYSYVLLAVGSIGLFFLTKTATGVLIALFSLAAAAVFQYLPKLRDSKVVKVLAMLGYAGCIMVSVLGAANAQRVSDYYWSRDSSTKTKVYVFLDKLLTGRLHTLACTRTGEGTLPTWRLFSNPQSNYYFDLGWVRLFYWYGIIPAVICVVVLLILLHFCFKKKDYMAVVMILSVTIYTVVEAHFVSVYLARNYLLLLLGMYWTRMLPQKGKHSENIRMV